MTSRRAGYRNAALLTGLVALGWLWDLALGGGRAHAPGLAGRAGRGGRHRPAGRPGRAPSASLARTSSRRPERARTAGPATAAVVIEPGHAGGPAAAGRGRGRRRHAVRGGRLRPHPGPGQPRGAGRGRAAAGRPATTRPRRRGRTDWRGRSDWRGRPDRLRPGRGGRRPAAHRGTVGAAPRHAARRRHRAGRAPPAGGPPSRATAGSPCAPSPTCPGTARSTPRWASPSSPNPRPRCGHCAPHEVELGLDAMGRRCVLERDLDPLAPAGDPSRLA